ncbi:MAG: aromatic ring-hydroxylating dioxygenase subunit alpha [Acidobacteriota bacterium]|nr:aromatic ring-hydroxylating dioxygenase subunit alpha [Acidobacteriota bacterium]
MTATEASVEAPASRSNGPSVQDVLARDRVPPPSTLCQESQIDFGHEPVPVERYISPEWHTLEVERLWKRVWQVACREDDLRRVGDTYVYDVADLSFLLVRAEAGIRGYWNACLHRAMKLRAEEGWTPELRCAFHGWSWSYDGNMKRMPCKWDFPHLRREDLVLPQVQVDTWNGWVFINPDLDAAPLSDYLGSMPSHFPWDTTGRSVTARVSKLLRCNWKAAMEAFMESYHVIATHPQILTMLADASAQYDVFPAEVEGQPGWNRFNTLSGVPSPHLRDFSDDQVLQALAAYYGIDLPSIAETGSARQSLAEALRAQSGKDTYSDSELLDNILYQVFPNFQPWAGVSPINYRFRPYGANPDECVMDVIFLIDTDSHEAPVPARVLGFDDDWTDAPELGLLAMVFDQDTSNLAHQQRGFKATKASGVQLASYQESRIRHFHHELGRWVGQA